MSFKKYHIIRCLSCFFVISFLTSCSDETSINSDNSEFKNEQKITILGYIDDAMEPFITKDDHYLFFNNLQGATEKDIFYAEKINDTTFQFKGEIQGVNSNFVDGNPTMDAQNNFYFISTRTLGTGNKTVFKGLFNQGVVTDLQQINGSINIATPSWINMGTEISKDGQTLLTSNAKFNIGDNFPSLGNIRLAIKEANEFNIPNNETDLLININTNNSIEYAGEISANELELFYSQVTLSNPAIFKLFYAKRDQINGVFNRPISITEPFKNNINAFVEAPTLSNNGKRLYYHKLDDNGVFSIFMLSRD
jgi:hypothetical protein